MLVGHGLASYCTASRGDTEAMVQAQTATEVAIRHLRRVACALLGDLSRGDAAVQEVLAGLGTRFTDETAQPSAMIDLYGNLWAVVQQNQAYSDVAERGGLPLSDGIEQALATIPPELRMTLILVVMERLSYEDTARVTGVETTTVRSRLAQARRILAEWMTSGTNATGAGQDRGLSIHAPSD